MTGVVQDVKHEWVHESVERRQFYADGVDMGAAIGDAKECVERRYDVVKIDDIRTILQTEETMSIASDDTGFVVVIKATVLNTVEEK